MHFNTLHGVVRKAFFALLPVWVIVQAGCPASVPPGDPNGDGGDDQPGGPPVPVVVTTVGNGTVSQETSDSATTLTAIPDAGWTFDAWSGADLDDLTANPLVITAEAGIESITANFVEEVSPPPPDADGDGVPDAQDDCAGTLPGVGVDENGCEIDQDGDGVADADDDCPTTPPGINVDARGCPVSQGAPDSDNDGVPDDIDQCADTPEGTTVDANGCPDSDGDGIADSLDDCPDTPQGTAVLINGCADGDGDGVADNEDLCDGTPAGAEVNENGCPDTDGDGVFDDDDACPDSPRGAVVNPSTGCPTSGGGGGGGGGGGNGGGDAVCGNGTRETGEQCDDGNTTSGDGCDENCLVEVESNDSCASPVAITVGVEPFSNAGATTDGPDELATNCALGGDTQIASDVWFCFTSPCTDTVVVSACGADFDTKMAAYEGCACPATPSAIECSDDDCGAGVGSRIRLPAQEGESFMIRIGGFGGEQGGGLLSLFCESDSDVGENACAAGAGECFADNGTPGCADTGCCSKTCQVDPFCCDVEWDAICAEKAEEVICRIDPPEACGPGAGSCTEAHGTPGCDVDLCCQAVCEQDPFCCLTEWDEFCVESAGPACGL